ncbi:MAG TPA: hypothetical protein VH369_21255 [Bryobacteraceae bacterium]|jgi:hypothetical protein
MFGSKPHSMILLAGLCSLPAYGAEVSVSVFDFAHVGDRTLDQAEKLAAEIFVSAGIVVRLTTAIPDGPLGSDFSAPSPDGCRESPLPVIIQVQILPHAPAGFRPSALGYSLPCAQSGAQITLYADRMEAVSRTTNASFYRVLGHSLAHELGHVLRRSEAHDASGLMKDVWTSADWRRAALSIVIFNSPQHPRNSNLSASPSPL